MTSKGAHPLAVPAQPTAVPFGAYHLLKRIAVGGMAELFLAEDTRTRKMVCIKRILPYLASEPEFVQMFLDEARIAAQLHHPNIVEVNELGKLGEHIFIAMEFCDGIDLRRILQQEQKRQATIPYAVASYIIARICEGLYYAHNRVGLDGKPLELIHRDISPQNVMVSYDGDIKLVDFGIAKASAVVERSKPGVIKGKYLYLAPEQLTQDRLDHRSDLFAVGSMLYEVTTGRSPFQKTTTEAVILAIRNEEPSPPHLIKNDYPLELSRIVMKCLVKDRNRRYQQASEIQEELDDFVQQTLVMNREALRAYIGRLFGAEEDRTVINLPAKPNLAKRLDDSNPEITASTQSERPAAIRPKSGDDDEPKTMTARPQDLVDAFGGQTGIGTAPERPRRSGELYEAAGSGNDDQTQMVSSDQATTGELSQPIIASRPQARIATPTLSPAVANPPAAQTAPQSSPVKKKTSSIPETFAPALSAEPSTSRERRKTSTSTSGSKPAPPVPSVSRAPAVPLGDREDDESTADFRLSRITRGLKEGGSEKAAMIGAIALLVAGVIALCVLIYKRTRPVETPPLPDIPEVVETPTPQDKPKKIVDDKPKTDGREAATDASKDAGVQVASSDTPDAGIAVAVANNDADDNERHPPSTKVPVIFKAPAGTDIRAGGAKRVPGKQYRFNPGNLKYTYKCPKKGSRVTTEYEKIRGSRVELITIKCPR